MFITSAVAGVIAHIRYIVDDLDDPFSGDWCVSTETFQRVRRALAREERGSEGGCE